MTPLLTALLPALLSATIDVVAGADPSAAIAAARPGDTIRLGPGLHAGSLGRVRGPLRITGAGAGITRVDAPEGEDGLVVEAGEVTITGLTLRASGPRAALKVFERGEVVANEVALLGGAIGAFVDGGRLQAGDADLVGRYAVLLRRGEAVLTSSRLRAGEAGLAQLGGSSNLRRITIAGPVTDAGVTITGGRAVLEDVIIRSSGPSGLAVLGNARVEARSLDISGAREEPGGYLGDCVMVRRGTLRLEASVLTRCGGAAVEAFSGDLELRGVDARGGTAGCLVLVERSRARLIGNRCSGRGPAVVAASGSQVSAAMNRWLADPVFWAECGSGARIRLEGGELAREPCRKDREPLDKPGRP